MKFVSAFVTLIAAAGCAMATYQALYNDVLALQSAARTLANQLNSASGTSYIEALQIDQAAKTLNTNIQDANTEASRTTVTTSQGQTILKVLSSTYSSVTSISQRLIALKPSWSKMGVAGIAKNDIALLSGTVKTFGNTLVAGSPSTLLPQAQTLANNYNSALNQALAAYS